MSQGGFLDVGSANQYASCRAHDGRLSQGHWDFRRPSASLENGLSRGSAAQALLPPLLPLADFRERVLLHDLAAAARVEIAPRTSMCSQSSRKIPRSVEQWRRVRHGLVVPSQYVYIVEGRDHGIRMRGEFRNPLIVLQPGFP